MTRYARELAALPATYAKACAWDVAPLARLVGSLSTQALRVVGSGGSYSLAAYCARLHSIRTRHAAHAATPLDVTQVPYLEGAGLLCLSASGRNKDIRAAFEASALAETKLTAALCLAQATPIKALSERYAFTDLIEAPLDIEADGFLAVNSLLATSVLLARAYRLASGQADALPPTFEELMSHAEFGPQSNFEDRLRRVLERRTISLLYSPTVAAAAVDLESRFVEGALGNLHSADWRNFGHGRHHWLAKRETETGVLALVAASDASLALRTLAMIPPTVPQAAVTFKGEIDVQAICALVVALRVAGSAGDVAGIDPGRPGVPEFGRKLFGLGPKVSVPTTAEAAIQRKSRAAPEIEDVFRTRYTEVVSTVSSARACGLVVDYDGTLCDRRRRFEPLPSEIASCLSQLALAGVVLGIATGRGQSAGVEIERVIPREAWSRVFIGYYNGAVIEPLGVRINGDAPSDSVAHIIGERLTTWFPQATVEVRNSQVSAHGFRHGRLPAIACTAARLLSSEGLPSYVVCSSHSIDVLLTDHRKSAVVGTIRAVAGKPGGDVIRIGDRGAWPGNDFDLLADPLGLSVDEVSRSAHACWNLAPPGLVGPQATLHYLSRLEWIDGEGLRLNIP